ncbi:hypothetical protein, partial [Pengzhenrongella sp.]|uniref:hypothetical protein n=1 Tax=Pengzhenrongella sp. TaxID=2888820 RepID=UPI002F9599EC
MGLARAAAVAETMGLFAAVAGEAASWATAERRAVLTYLDRSIDVLTTVRATVLVAERDSAAWVGSGDGSFERWRGRTSRTGKRVARAQVRQATELGAVPGATTAVIEGRIGLDHAKAIGRIASSSSSPTVREAARSPEGQTHLLGLAETMDA